MKNKIRVLCVQPDPNDATSFYRSMGPIGYMRRQTDEIEFVPVPKGFNVTWSFLSQGDMLFLQRPFGPEHFKLCDMAKDNGLKLWVDYDDDIFNLPLHNHVRAIYEAKNHKENAQKCLQLSDMVTVSTQKLADLFSNDEKIHVVPNALDDHRFPIEEKKEMSKIVMWRGSKTHEVDLAEVEDDLVKLISKNNKWQFCFIGEHHWRTIDRLQGFRNVSFFEGKDVIQYHRALKKLNPDINLVPLQDIPFNHAKSMCSWIEATFAGAVSVAPDWQEWNRPGITNYEKGKFADTVQELIENESQRYLDFGMSKREIEENLSLKQTGQKRIEIIKALF